MDEVSGGGTFAHVGCLFGSILGLSVGVVLAWLLTVRTGSLALALGAWVVLTIALAGVGYAVGQRRQRA